MKVTVVGFICLCALVVYSQAWAGALVKSIDADGNVTYSSTPTVDAETITDVYIESGPSAKQIDAAQEQAQKTIDQADKAQQKRTKSAKKKSTKKKSATKKKSSSTGREYSDSDHGGSQRGRPVVSGTRSSGSGADHPAYTPPASKPAVLPTKR